MDLPENPRAAATTDVDVASQLRTLNSVLAFVLGAMLLISGAMFLFIYRQVVNLNRQVTEGYKMVNEFNSNALPKINWFFVNLQAFSKTNPDFGPILGKYNLLPAPGTPAAVPAPGPVAPKK